MSAFGCKAGIGQPLLIDLVYEYTHFFELVFPASSTGGRLHFQAGPLTGRPHYSRGAVADAARHGRWFLKPVAKVWSRVWFLPGRALRNAEFSALSRQCRLHPQKRTLLDRPAAYCSNAFANSSCSRRRSSSLSLSGSRTTASFVSVPVKGKGILLSYSSSTGVPVSCPTSNVSSGEKRTPTVWGMRPCATSFSSTSSVAVAALPMPPPS